MITLHIEALTIQELRAKALAAVGGGEVELVCNRDPNQMEFDFSKQAAKEVAATKSASTVVDEARMAAALSEPVEEIAPSSPLAGLVTGAKRGRKPKEAKAPAPAPEFSPVAETPVVEEAVSEEVVSASIAQTDANSVPTKLDAQNALNAVMGKKGVAEAGKCLGKFGVRRIGELAEDQYPAFIAECGKAAS